MAYDNPSWRVPPRGPRSSSPVATGSFSEAADVGRPSSRSNSDGNGGRTRPQHASLQEADPSLTSSGAASDISSTRLRTSARTASRTYSTSAHSSSKQSIDHHRKSILPPGRSPDAPSAGVMSYPYRHDPQHRPLIDLIPEHSHDLDVSDEEDAFYAHDEGDYLLHPKWRALVTHTANRVPRRIRRYFVIYLLCALVFLISWRAYLGPRYAVYRQELVDMESTPKEAFGKNVRPEFKGMIQVQRMEERMLPKGDGRLVVVGDVHGCREELEHLLSKVDFREGNDHLVLTGDIIAKGPDSPGVVSLARRLHASCVRGNHEDKVLLSLASATTAPQPNPAVPGPNEAPTRPSDFLDEASFAHGDSSVRRLAKSFSHADIAYLQQCPVILHVGRISDALPDVVVVHAGLVPGITLENQDPFQVMNMRTIDLKTRLPSEKRDGTPWEKFWNHQQMKKPAHERTTIIYGHDRKRGMNVQKYSVGLDSGCVSGGRLTAMVIDSSGKHTFVDVKCKGYVD